MSGRESAIRRPSRSPSGRTTLLLYVRAGGRCELDGCNKYLLEHGPTHTTGNFADRGHIYGFMPSAARGLASGRPPPEEINGVDNLILLCKECHHLVDGVAPDDYPVEVLREFKRTHEERVFDLTGISTNRDFVPVVVRALVASRPVDLSDHEMQCAVIPNYIKRRERVEVDLTTIPDDPCAAYWESCASAIESKVRRLYEARIDPEKAVRVAVFAMGPIPLLVHLGSCLSDKLDVDLYQLQRNPRSWSWLSGPGELRYRSSLLAKGSDGANVALLVNLSGRNNEETVRTKELGEQPWIYEITLADREPETNLLRARADLDRFVEEYGCLLARIRQAHPWVRSIHVFPAVPASVAVAMGLHRLPKVDPSLLIYDRDERRGGFVRTMEVK